MKLGTYKHYKGKLYRVLGVAMHTEEETKMVVYQALHDCPDLEVEYGIRPMFARPYDMFNENVIIEGKEMPRFECISEE